MITILHQGQEQTDKIEIEANTMEEAIDKLLKERNVIEINELQPPQIETKWR